MTPKIEMMLQAFKDKDYKAQRTPAESITLAKGATAAEYVDAFRSIMEAEAPVLFSEDMFGFNCSTARRMTTTGGNFTPDYPRVLSMGFDALKVQIEENMQRTDDAEKLAYGKAMAECIDLCLASADRYRAAASISGNTRLYNALSRVPHKGATTFYEACVFLKFCAYCLRFGFVCHVGFGRFDQYMYPYYLKDKARGISDDEIFETL